MEVMFRYCSSLTSLDVTNFDTSNVTSMRGMFACCEGLTHLDLSSFDSSSYTTGANQSIIDNAINLKTIYISNKFVNIFALDFKGPPVSNMTIYCEASEPLPGWRDKWNYYISSPYNTVFNTTHEQYLEIIKNL